jgi:putative phage-type endonuclease
MAPRRQPHQGSAEWYAERRTGYGASDAPILVEGDEAAWRQLHGEKLGLLPHREGSETMDLGKRLEDVIARAAADRLGERLVRVNRIVRHPELPHVFASLDRRRRLSAQRAWRPVEIKKWGHKTDDFGQAGSDIVPVRWLYQVQQQAAVTGADAVDIWVLFGGSKLEPFTVGRDQSMIDEILELETAAWAYVARGEMPPWPGQAPRRIVLAADEIEVDDTIRNLVEIHETADAKAKRAAQELKDAKDRLRAALADVGAAKGLMADGRKVSVSHRPQEPSRSVEHELVASAYRHALEELVGYAQALKSPRAVKAIGAGDDFYHALDAAQGALEVAESLFTTTKAGQRQLRVTLKESRANAA